MIAKLSNRLEGKPWYKLLGDIEYFLNNTVNRSTGKSPCQLVFGMSQRGSHADHLREWLEADCIMPGFEKIREEAIGRMLQEQQKQRLHYDRKHKVPIKYKAGDLVMVKNFDSTPGASKKLLPKYRSPYEVKKILGNDRYLLTDVPGFQNTQKLYTGTWAAGNMRRWIRTTTSE
ncbi:hypothetical protein ALC60_13230 [Trachymyrmex zeteki]|uniref:Uncharacterized protein n=1 Tax=Mycetomoellerius zeteki TaxID=64791 RepID=A0A151WIR9_9HYME|nr:hypothetical protein ALC60_13230 [Trachymyrmex zeteki]